MTAIPERSDLEAALAAAGAAHHDYQCVALGGARDEEWAGWYAAYTLGRLGDFTSPSQLTTWLREVETDGPWASVAADYVADRLDPV